jgi:hypothetical protein
VVEQLVLTIGCGADITAVEPVPTVNVTVEPLRLPATAVLTVAVKVGGVVEYIETVLLPELLVSVVVVADAPEALLKFDSVVEFAEAK